ncbi:MAG: hypothetical protein E7405_01180 [Ruminococcaceae bacterium]|nr:hypothetical protein [Oscillospiraceae bacterium]
MEFKKFKFDPEGGFLDGDFYEDTPANAREILQRQHNQTKDFINSVIDTLNCNKEGESGGEFIKSPDIEGVKGDNLFTQIKDVKRQLNDIALNNVPDGSIDEYKLKNESVTRGKIKNGEITTEKFSPDSVAPLSSDTLNINNIPSSHYLPIEKMGDINTYKDYIGPYTLSTIWGKTKGNKHYVKSGKNLYEVNLENGETIKISEEEFNNYNTYYIDNDDNIVMVKLTVVSGEGTLEFFKYNREDNEFNFYNSITVFPKQGDNYLVYDANTDENDIYIVFTNLSESTCYLYKINVSDKELESYEILGSFSKKEDFKILFTDEDIILGEKIIKNKDFNQMITLNYRVIGYDNGNLLIINSYVLVLSDKTYIPKVMTVAKNENFNFFLKDNFLYKRIGDHLVKTRLL